ncbi:MAG: LPS export ABC transporter periplasmic protein LptC [Hyphomonadaceae bacterium]
MNAHAHTIEDSSPLAEARMQALAAARKRSRLVAGLRRLFTAAAGASFASVFVSMGVFAAQGGFSGNDLRNAEPLRMINPRFTGRTEGDVAYQLTADVAARGEEGERLMRLAAPVYQDAAGAAIIAPRGTYDEAAGEVRLVDGVVFTDKAGNRFTTPTVRIDVETGRVIGEQGVTGAGPLGVVRAETYELRQSDRAVVLRGGVRGMIRDGHGGPTGEPMGQPVGQPNGGGGE